MGLTPTTTPPMDAPDILPDGLVKIDAPDTLHGWKLVEIDSAEHRAAIAADPPKKAKTK